MPVVIAALDLLESHHSKPFYQKIRRMSWWQGQKFWKGAWQTGGKGKGKDAGGKQNQRRPQQNGKKNKEQKDEKEGPKFPSYDAMQVGEPTSLQSSSSGSGQEDKLKRLMRDLVENNGVKLSPEAMKLLEEDEQTDFRAEMKKAQVILNKKRKAHSKLQRLKEALNTKHEQFRAFKATLREQLQTQQEKYETDVASLQNNIEEAEEALKKTEEEADGIDAQEVKMEDATVVADDLELLLETGKTAEKQVVHLAEQLKESREENVTTKRMFNAQAAQMQSYMQRLEQMQAMLIAHQQPAVGAASPRPAGLPLPPTPTTPQMQQQPVIQQRKDPLAPFGKVQDARKARPEPFNRVNATILVGDSPVKNLGADGKDEDPARSRSPPMGKMD